MNITRIAMLLSLAAFSFTPCRAVELIIDGGFEQSGTAGQLVGWTIQNQEGSSGLFQLETPGTPSSFGAPTADNASGGNYYAVTDYAPGETPGTPGAHVLLQKFTLPSDFLGTVTLSFQMFVNNYTATSGTGNPLDYTISPSQYARVDILTADANPFTIGTGVVKNLYLGATQDFNEYSLYSFDLTSYLSASGTYQIRFAEVDNQNVMNVGVDNVSITTAPVPEPASLCMLGLGAAGLLWKGRKRFCR